MPPKRELPQELPQELPPGHQALAGQIDLNAPWVKPGFFDEACFIVWGGATARTVNAAVNATPLAEARAAAAEADRTVNRLTDYYKECCDRDMHFRDRMAAAAEDSQGAIEEDVEAAAEEDDEAAAAAIFEEDVESDPVKSDPHRSKRLRTAAATKRAAKASAQEATKRAAKAAAQETANAKEDLASWTTYAKECGKYFVYLNSIGDAHESTQFDKYDSYFWGIEQRHIEQDEKRKAAGKPADS